MASKTSAAEAFFAWIKTYLIDRLREPDAITWHLDQAALAVAYLRNPEAARFAFLPPGLMYSSSGAIAPSDLPADTVFWSITFSIGQNAINLEHERFASYVE